MKPKQPILFCFCAPTASGKTTITRELVRLDPSLVLSISTTTRAARPTEVDGRDYHFVSEEEFERRVGAGRFLEHAKFSGSRYGTGIENIERASADKVDLVLDIDVQGVEQIRRIAPKQLAVVFVFPPSFQVLKERLIARGTEDAEKMRMRLEAAERELVTLTTQGFSDYLLINDDLPTALGRAQSIIEAERMRAARLDLTTLAPA